MKFKVTWDKTNIGENYPGITYPLTYSFIRKAYSNVYSHFLHLVGVKKGKVRASRMILDNMLGYIKGEIFYNIDNWYEFLKLLPGYSYNKGFFENMLRPVTERKEKQSTGSLFGLKTLWINKKVLFKMFYSIQFIRGLYRQFEEKYNFYLMEYKKVNIHALNNFGLVTFFERLQTQFFSLWSIPIVNDFRVMIYFGLLTKFIEKNMPEDAGTIICSIYGLKHKPESLNPLLELIHITQFIKKKELYTQLFNKDSETIYRNFTKQEFKEIKVKIDRYIENYGERSFNELKLEEVNFKDSPESLINILKYYCAFSQNELEELLKRISRHTVRNVNQHAVRFPFFKRIIFGYLKKQTISSIFKREEYRLKRGKVFHIARVIFKEIGKRLKQAGDLDNADDIFFLYIDEVFDYMRFHRFNDDFRRIVRLRKELLKEYAKSTLPRRIITEDLPSHGNTSSLYNRPKKNKNLNGTVTSKGKIKDAEVVVMEQLNFKINVNNKVLVTKTTDPGWTVLFPLIKGIIIEQGGVLSHASIVARELGIPCFVIPDATTILKNGSRVEMNSDNKTVTVLN